MVQNAEGNSEPYESQSPMGAEENAEEDRRLERRELRNRSGESNRRAEGELRCVEGGSRIRKSQSIVRELELGEDGGMAYREEQLRGTPPFGTLFELTNCSDEQRGLVVAGLGRWVENEDQQSSNRAPLHRSTIAQGESGSKPVGLWRAFCLGPIEELRQTNGPPVAKAGAGSRSNLEGKFSELGTKHQSIGMLRAREFMKMGDLDAWSSLVQRKIS